MGFYFRDVYEFLFASRYVTARILAEESLEGLEVVFAVTAVCLVLRTLIVKVQLFLNFSTRLID